MLIKLNKKDVDNKRIDNSLADDSLVDEGGGAKPNAGDGLSRGPSSSQNLSGQNRLGQNLSGQNLPGRRRSSHGAPDAGPLRSSGAMGADIRALRRSRNWTLSDLGDHLDRSVGWLSQVERGVSEPALADIRHIAALFDLPVSFFFSQSPDTPEGAYIVRAESRRAMSDEGKGLVESLLSPDLGGAFEIVHSVFAAGARCPQPFVRPTEEAGYVIDGTLTLIIDDQVFNLNKGDSFRFSGEMVSWVNNGDVPAVLIWVIAPPVY